MNRRRLLQSGIPEGFVDLGLPSGLLWAQGNIVKNGNKYSIGEETDYGAYFSWGNIDGHNEGEGYSFDSTTYNSTAGKSLTTNIASNDAAHDAALACLGSPCRLPSRESFLELCDNTDMLWTTINGVSGRKFMKKTDHSVYIFLPAASYYYGTSKQRGDSEGHYWSSSYYISSAAYNMWFSSSSYNYNNNNYRYTGLPIRAVKVNKQMKGKLSLSWETQNVDASSHYSIKLCVYYSGEILPGMSVSYLTSSGISVYRYSSLPYLEINVEPNTNTSDVTKSVTITYNGVSKTAYVYLSGDEIDHTETTAVVTGVSGECLNDNGGAGYNPGVDFSYSYSGSCSGTIDVEETETNYWISGNETTGSTDTSSYPIKSANIAVDGYINGILDIVNSAYITLTDIYGDSYDFELSEDAIGSNGYVENISFHQSGYSDDVISGGVYFDGTPTFCF